MLGDINSLDANNKNITKWDDRVINEIVDILQYIPDDDINAKNFIAMVAGNVGVKNMKKYISRKSEYLKHNCKLTEEQFNGLFGSLSKKGKISINQRSLAMCQMYTALEILKKMNFFNELIRTHLKKTKFGWKVKIPFFSKDGIWIKVKKNEIDKNFIGNIKGAEYNFGINSESEFLGFKILEIAFIKRMQAEPGPNYEEHEHDLQTTGDCRLDPENIIFHRRDYFTKIFKILFKNLYSTWSCNDECKDFAFKYFDMGIYGINLSVDKNILDEMLVNNNQESKGLDGAIVEGNIVRDGKHIEMMLPHNQYFMNDGKHMVRFFDKHSYSIEKCYISNTGEKRCWIVNPWHTDIKFDISFEDCKKIFKFNLICFDYKNMFI